MFFGAVGSRNFGTSLFLGVAFFLTSMIVLSRYSVLARFFLRNYIQFRSLTSCCCWWWWCWWCSSFPRVPGKTFFVRTTLLSRSSRWMMGNALCLWWWWWWWWWWNGKCPPKNSGPGCSVDQVIRCYHLSQAVRCRKDRCFLRITFFGFLYRR